MTGTLIVTAFGDMTFDPRRSSEDGEADLYFVFLSRSELMGWTKMGSSKEPAVTLLWGMNEAEFSEDDGPEIGFVQVGLDYFHGTYPSEDHPIADELPPDVDLSQGGWAAFPTPDDQGPPADAALAIPPLVQCVDDSLRWFGEVDISAYEVLAYDLVPNQRPHWWTLHSASGWFKRGDPERIQAVVTLGTGQASDVITPESFKKLPPEHADPFGFGPSITPPNERPTRPDLHWVDWTSAVAGIEVSMPEWSAGAIGWVIAMVYESVLSHEMAPQNLWVRVTRSPN